MMHPIYNRLYILRKKVCAVLYVGHLYTYVAAL